MTKPNILLQLDPDPQPSVFDGVVAVDSGADQLFRHANVQNSQVRDLVYGAMFTRGPEDLHHTAIFVGGSNVSSGESLLEQVVGCFFGPMRVSVMIDSNGANTTAAAAVIAAARHIDLQGAAATVLGGTGPVGQRVARLLAQSGTSVRIGSRSFEKAEAVASKIRENNSAANVEPYQCSTSDESTRAIQDVQLVIAAGATGIELLPGESLNTSSGLQAAIDLNAVPPAGISGIEMTDKAVKRNDVICYGAIGVGNTKMKIHKAAIAELFQSNDVVLDAEEIYEIGRKLEAR